LDPETLWDFVQSASAKRAVMKRKAEKMRDDLILNGAENLVTTCLGLLN